MEQEIGTPEHRRKIGHQIIMDRDRKIQGLSLCAEH